MLASWQISNLQREAERAYGNGASVRQYIDGPWCYVDFISPDNVRTHASYFGNNWGIAYEKALAGITRSANVVESMTPMLVSVATEAEVPGIEGSTPTMQAQYDRSFVGQMVATRDAVYFKPSSVPYSEGGRMMRASVHPLVNTHTIDSDKKGAAEVATNANVKPSYFDAVTVGMTTLGTAGAMTDDRSELRNLVDRVNTLEQNSVARKKETPAVTTPNAPKTNLKETLTTDATDAAWRVAGSQMTKMVREPLVATLSRNLAPGDDAVRARIAAFLETEVGAGILSGMISAGLSAIPAPPGSQAEAINGRLARELRVRSMATVGDALADVLAGPLREVAATYLRGVPEVAAGLPEGSPRVTDATFETATVPR
jgi:hypothetical protein